ncbi:hypothetical protein Tco_0555836 [Tanacetum coccineum]
MDNNHLFSLCFLDTYGNNNIYEIKDLQILAAMSSASFAVTYTSVYTDSEPGRVFWGADEEISDGGSPRVIVLGYDGLPMQPVAPPSPDYIPGPEEPHTPPGSVLLDTQALVDAVTAALPSPPLPPSLYIPPPVNRKNDIPESERPPRNRSCLFALGSKYEARESSTARPTRGRGIDYGFVSTLDAEKRRRGIREVGYGIRDTWVDSAEAVPEIAHMTLGEVNTRVTELAELYEHDTHDLYITTRKFSSM